MDSDFTVGFKQGQAHGKQIVMEKVNDAIKEIEQECVGDYTYDKVAKLHCIDILNKHLERN